MLAARSLLGFLPVRIGDVGRLRTLSVLADRYLLALGHVDDLARFSFHLKITGGDRQPALQDDHDVIDGDRLAHRLVGRIASETERDGGTMTFHPRGFP
jgi:hypothetical protein